MLRLLGFERKAGRPRGRNQIEIWYLGLRADGEDAQAAYETLAREGFVEQRKKVEHPDVAAVEAVYKALQCRRTYWDSTLRAKETEHAAAFKLDPRLPEGDALRLLRLMSAGLKDLPTPRNWTKVGGVLS